MIQGKINRANKISLNASKSELILFKDPRKRLNHDLKIKIDGKRLVPQKFVKYLGIYIDCHLNWKNRYVKLLPDFPEKMVCSVKLDILLVLKH